MNSPYRRQHRQSNVGLGIVLLLVVVAARNCEKEQPPPTSRISTPVENPIEDALRPGPFAANRKGVAAAVLIDTSGSMAEKVRDTDGTMQPKIGIAQRAALNLVDQFDKYAREHSDQTVLLGVYEFSDRGRGPSCRSVIDLGRPDAAAARSAIMQMHPDGDTPIGDALIKAKREVDASHVSKRHILVITDGENTKGYRPEDVTRAISRQSEQDRASIYFVAFDVAADKFNSVRDAGGLVLAASNETDLKQTLDYLLTGQILAEQPEHR